MWKSSYAASIVLFALCAAPAQAATAVRIEIHSAWAGLGNPSRTDLVIQKTPDGYREGGKRIDGRAVADLVAALREPPMTAPEPRAFGIGPAWLKAHADDSGIWDEVPSGATPEQRALLHKSFLDIAVVARAFRDSFRLDHTDDYPSIELRISFDDGSALTAKTDSQSLMMLPWETGGAYAYNPDITRAVAALMPPDATNRPRLNDGYLSGAVARAVLYHLMKTNWKVSGNQ